MFKNVNKTYKKVNGKLKPVNKTVNTGYNFGKNSFYANALNKLPKKDLIKFLKSVNRTNLGKYLGAYGTALSAQAINNAEINKTASNKTNNGKTDKGTQNKIRNSVDQQQAQNTGSTTTTQTSQKKGGFNPHLIDNTSDSSKEVVYEREF